MRLGFLCLFMGWSFSAPAQSVPSPEAFVNAIYHTVVDSSFSQYYLCEKAYPCSFVKYDYDEWVKYALYEEVPIYTLNELAEHSYNDRQPRQWPSTGLTGARLVTEQAAKLLTDPLRGADPDTAVISARQKRIRQRLWKKWAAQPPQDRTVFFFSRPVFTTDGNYAIIDLDYRCDPRQCGMGATCLFRKTEKGWKLIGRQTRWGG